MNWLGRSVVTMCDIRMKDSSTIPSSTTGVVEKLIHDTGGKLSYASVVLNSGGKVVVRLANLCVLTDTAKEVLELRAEVERLKAELAQRDIDPATARAKEGNR